MELRLFLKHDKVIDIGLYINDNAILSNDGGYGHNYGTLEAPIIIKDDATNALPG